MTTTVIGATGRVGSAVTQRLLDTGTTVRVLVRDPDKARQLFGNDPHLEIIPARLDAPAAVAAGLMGSATAFLAMGSIGIEASASSPTPQPGDSTTISPAPARSAGPRRCRSSRPNSARR